MDLTLAALYEVQRQSFLTGYIAHPENFSDSLAYAYYNRIAPIFDDGVAREHYGCDIFEEVYFVKSIFISQVLKYIDECWLTHELDKIDFYTLEAKFGEYKSKRIELIFSLEYARISGRFDAEVWKAIESKAPAEANPLASQFKPSDVHFH